MLRPTLTWQPHSGNALSVNVGNLLVVKPLDLAPRALFYPKGLEMSTDVNTRMSKLKSELFKAEK